MDKKNNNYLRYFGLTAENFVGYLYCGVINILIIVYILPDEIAFIKEKSGTLTLFIAGFVSGILVYTIYYRIIGEIFIYPLQYKLHTIFDKIGNKKGENLTSTTKYLRFLGVNKWTAHDAYEDIKDNLFTDNIKNKIALIHGELHILYLTFVLSSLVSLIFVFQENENLYWAILVSLFLFCIALVADTRAQSKETFYIKSMDRNSLKTFLVLNGYLKSQISFHHIGLITFDISKFEDFWCKELGYTPYFSSEISKEMTLALFHEEFRGKLRRYKHDYFPEVEIHSVEPTNSQKKNLFSNFGFNHICLVSTNRSEFLKQLDPKIPIHLYQNPKGWNNIFIRDYEGNWIEIREEPLQLRK